MAEAINQHKRMAMGRKVMKRGGMVHDDAAADRKLIKEELAKKGLKKGGMTCKSKG